MLHQHITLEGESLTCNDVLALYGSHFVVYMKPALTSRHQDVHLSCNPIICNLHYSFDCVHELHLHSPFTG